MEIKQLRYLIEIVECGTMLKAAEKLYITQSGLTRSIKNLEDELGMELFERKGNRLVINSYGEIIYQEGKRIVEEIEELEKRVKRDYFLSKNVLVGSLAPAPLWVIRSVYSKVYQGSRLEYEIKDEDVLLEELANHYYSAIILDHPIENSDYYCFKVCEEVLNISVSDGHPLANFANISFKELNGYHFLEYQNTGKWHDLCMKHMPDSRFVIQDDEELYNILQRESSLITFRTSLTIPRFSLYENRNYIPIVDKEATQCFYLICFKKDRDYWFKIKDSLKDIKWVDYRVEDFEIK